MSQLSDLTDLIGVINAVRGRGQTVTTSGGTSTQTQRTDVSDVGIQQLLNDILSGPGGVRSVGNAARSAGMYDSTVEDIMLSDLYSRAANRAELARSPTITETTTPEIVQETAMPGVGLGGLAGTLAGTSALSSIMRGEIPFSGIFNGGEAMGMGSLPGMGGVSDMLGGILGGGGGGAAGIPGGFMGQVATGGGAGAALPGGFMGQIGGGGAVGSGAPISGGFMSQIGAGGAGSAGAGGFMSSVPGGPGAMIPGAGGFLSGLTQKEDALDSPGKLAATAGTGFMAGGPLGAAAAVSAAILGSVARGGSLQGTVQGIPVVGSTLGSIVGEGKRFVSSIGSAGRSVGKELKRFGRKLGF